MLRSKLLACLFAAVSLLVVTSAWAFPGFVVGKGGEQAAVHSTHIVLMKKAGRTAVTVMPDYQGAIEPFGLVLVVPGDVNAEHVVTLKRDFVDRLDKLSAPRFHDFYEPDPCEHGEWGQEWDRDLRAKSAGAILGEFKTDPSKKVAKELFVDTNAKQKEGEYEISVLDDRAALEAWMSKEGFKAPGGALESLAPYLSGGMKVLALKADSRRIELVGGDRAQLSPVRFWTDAAVESLPLKLGLHSAPEFQEVLIYVLDPDKRYKATNYDTVVPPTNVTVTDAVWERVGEFYNAIYDRLLKKNPKTVLVEFAWPVEGCGEPCPDAPLALAELLSLGGDVFELAIPEGERRPEPEEPTEEEEKKFEASVEGMKPKEKKEAKKAWEEERGQIAYVKALQERNNYILTRLHYRYNKASLPEDLKLGPNGALGGGTDLPKGPKGEASSEIKQGSENRLQVRFNYLEPNKKVINCPDPQRYRWGKRPREVRRLRKVWVAQDLTRKSRTQIKLEEVVKSPVPALGLTGVAEAAPADAGADAAPEAEKKSNDGCGCRMVGTQSGRFGRAGGLWLALALLLWVRRPRKRP